MFAFIIISSIFLNINTLEHNYRVSIVDDVELLDWHKLSEEKSIRTLNGRKLNYEEFNPFDIDYLWGWVLDDNDSFAQLFNKEDLKREEIDIRDYHYAGRIIIQSGIDSYVILSKIKKREVEDIDVFLLNCKNGLLVSCVRIAGIYFDEEFGSSSVDTVGSIDSMGKIVFTHQTLSTDFLVEGLDGQEKLPPSYTFKIRVNKNGVCELLDNDNRNIINNVENKKTKKSPWILSFIGVVGSIAFLLLLIRFLVIFKNGNIGIPKKK